MSAPIDMVQVVTSLPSRPRGRACIVLTHEYEGRDEWAAELARRTDSDHLDLLALFAQDADLAGRISHFPVSGLFEFLKDRGQSPVLIVTGLEFLKATWSGMPRAITGFLEQIKTWDAEPCLLIVLQFDKVIAAYDFGRRFSNQYVIDQKETLAL